MASRILSASLSVAVVAFYASIGCGSDDTNDEAADSHDHGAEEHGAEEHGAEEHGAEEHGADTHDHGVDTDQTDPVVIYCNCALANCHEPYHMKWGEDEIAAQEACLMEAEGLPVNGAPTEMGNFLECRQHFCDAAATDDTVCANALGDAVCI